MRHTGKPSAAAADLSGNGARRSPIVLASMSRTRHRIASGVALVVALFHVVLGAAYWLGQDRPALATVSGAIAAGIAVLAILGFGRRELGWAALGCAVATLPVVLVYGV
jgi:hypothetical protein